MSERLKYGMMTWSQQLNHGYRCHCLVFTDEDKTLPMMTHGTNLFPGSKVQTELLRKVKRADNSELGFWILSRMIGGNAGKLLRSHNNFWGH